MTQVLEYTVQLGDSLSAIANHINASAGVTYQQIASANQLTDPGAITPEQILKIPVSDQSSDWLYIVQPGDSLSAIAAGINQCQGITVQEIITANPGTDPDKIYPGQQLKLTRADVPATSTGDKTCPSASDAQYKGYWNWTWSSSTETPAGTNLGIAFSGWADVSKAVSQSAHVKDHLPGQKFLSLGGGAEDTGAFSQAFLQQIDQAIADGTFEGYDGLAYDIEVGASGLADDFAQSFATAKASGLKVLVTISHSAPYGIADGAALMHGFFSDSNIDYISPQLYTTGKETSNDYADPALSWSAYADSKALIIPSIVSANLYDDAVAYFEQRGITLAGYIQWQQV